ncbi:MAG: EamA family transporter [Jiangellaceae bacterium]
MGHISPRRGLLYVTIAAALFSVNASVSKVALEARVEPVRLAAMRSTGAAVLLFVVLFATQPGRLRLTWRELPYLAVLGILGGAVVQWLYFVAIDRLPVGIALLLEFTAPAMVALFSWAVLRQHIRPRTWLGIALAMAGLVLVAQVWSDIGLDVIGVFAGLAAAACLASYYLVGKRLTSHRDSLSLTFWMFAFAAIFWAVVRPWWTFDPGPLDEQTSLLGIFDSVHVPVWSTVLWIIVFGTLIAYGLNLAALRHISPTTAGVVGMSEPVGAALVAWIWLGQSLNPVQIFGGVVVLFGIGLAETGQRGSAPRPHDGAATGQPARSDGVTVTE